MNQDDTGEEPSETPEKKDDKPNYDSRKINLSVFKMRIMLNTNIPGMETKPLTFDMLYHHDLERGKFSGKSYTMPYFTHSVKYPADVLAEKTYSDRVDFFFNKARFNKILRKNIIDYIDENDEDVNYIKDSGDEEEDTYNTQVRSNADHNVKTMLLLLFPVADEFGNSFATSYDQYILHKPSPDLFNLRKIDPTTFLNSSFLPLYNYFNQRTYEAPLQEISYLQISGTKYVVSGVVWQNDIINHPVYNQFLSVYYNRIRDKETNRRAIREALKDRTVIFQDILVRYANYPDKNTNPAKTVFEAMTEILIQNSRGATPNTRTPNTVYEMTNDEMIKRNQAEYAKRGIIEKIVNSLGVVDDIYRGYDGKLTGTTSNNAQRLTNKAIKSLSQERLNFIADNIANAYIEYTTYNSKAKEGGTDLNLRDTSRILSEVYNAALFLKTIRLLDEFIKDNIRRLDLDPKNADGTDKPKLEADIINTINKNFNMYYKINQDLSEQVRNVVEPARRSSNLTLQNYLKELNKPTSEDVPDKYALVDIYNQYIANIKKGTKSKYVENYMNVGVSSVSGEKDDSGEIPEIYVYMNVVSKDDYEQNRNRDCIMSDDRIANNLRQVLYANTMLNNTFPELNPYRAFKLLKGSEVNAKRDIVLNENTVVSPSSAPVSAPLPKGGRRRKSRKYTKSGRKHTRKYTHRRV